MNLQKIVAAAGVTAVAILGVASAAHTTVDHCPDHQSYPKNESPHRDDVPAAGAVICVKAGTGNTGKIVADGNTTLADYLANAGITGGDGEGRDPSYVVTYGEQPPPSSSTTTGPHQTTTTTGPSPTTTTVNPSTTTTQPPTVTTVPEAPHNVCPDGTGHTFKTDQPCPEPKTTNPTVPVNRTELPQTGASGSDLALFGALLLIVGGALFVITKP